MKSLLYPVLINGICDVLWHWGHGMRLTNDYELFTQDVSWSWTIHIFSKTGQRCMSIIDLDVRVGYIIVKHGCHFESWSLGIIIQGSFC